jgi:hypothetical protein
MPRAQNGKQEIVKHETFAPLAIPVERFEELSEALTENVGGKMGLFDFDEIAVPTSGHTTWEVPTLAGPQSTQGIEAVILRKTDVREYYAEAYTGESSPPSCSSPDQVTGYGDPGGACERCPFSQWGTAKDAKGAPTRGQACSQRIHLLALTPYNVMPYFLNVPPTSLKETNRFMRRLATESIPYHRALVVLRLARVKVGTYDVAQVAWEFVRRLDDAELARVAALRATFDAILKRSIQTQHDAVPGPGSEAPIVDERAEQ